MADAAAAARRRRRRFLMVFDFDETLANESSDDAVVRAAPGGRELPDWLRAQYREGRYNEHMQRVMAWLGQQGVTEGAVRAEIQNIPETPGLTALLSFLRAHADDFECVVMSDANAYFIEAWLEHTGARQLFLEIFTNPAHFDDASGRLVLAPFHAHSCPRCPDNMCKQRILRDFLARRSERSGGHQERSGGHQESSERSDGHQERSGGHQEHQERSDGHQQRAYERVFYVGDGANDVCPCLALETQDVAFARRDFPMHRLLTADTHDTHTHTHAHAHARTAATVQPWSSGHDVVQYLQRALEER